jgi:AraC-like DNA-binding protein
MGFNDNSAFHKAFKRWTDSTPKEYRQKMDK